MAQEKRTAVQKGTGRAGLEARLREYHGVSLENVLAEIAYLRDRGDSVIAGGSLVYGLGNRLSDLDLLIAGSTTLESTRVPIEQFVGSLRIDVWKLAQRLIEETFERAEAALAGETALHDSFGDSDHETEPKLLHRIAFGVTIDGDGLELSPGRDHAVIATALVAREYLERMRASALIAQLAVRAERPLAAAVNARQAVEEALNATVANRGFPYSGDKWLGERLAHDAPDLAAVHEPFWRLPEDPPREAAEFVGRAIAVCSEMWGLDLGVTALAPAAHWRAAGLRGVEAGNDRLLISARFGAVWNLNESEAASWQRLDSEVGAGGGDAAWDVGECEGDAADLCLLLHERGLLELQWAEGVAIEGLDTGRVGTV
jgi:hypothetical protein